MNDLNLTAEAWRRNRGQLAADLVEIRHPSGISLWKLGPAACVTESLDSDAPEIYVEIMRDRVLANLTGSCPECGAAASITTPGRGEIAHHAGCLAGHPPRRMLDHLNPAATAAIATVKGLR